MGNTSVGKTSLVNTFKNYIENPTEEPVPILTQKDDTLIETKVLEIYKNVDLKSNHRSLNIDLKKMTSNVELISFEEASTDPGDETSRKRLKLSFVDFGGRCQVVFQPEVIILADRALVRGDLDTRDTCFICYADPGPIKPLLSRKEAIQETHSRSGEVRSRMGRVRLRRRRLRR